MTTSLCVIQPGIIRQWTHCQSLQRPLPIRCRLAPQTDAEQPEVTEAFAEIAGSLFKSFLCMTPHEALVSCDRSSDTLGHSRHFEVLWALALSLTLLNVLLTSCQHILLVPFLAK